jgi:hypothetical protein
VRRYLGTIASYPQSHPRFHYAGPKRKGNDRWRLLRCALEVLKRPYRPPHTNKGMFRSNSPNRQYAISSLRAVLRRDAQDIFWATLAEERSLVLRNWFCIPVMSERGDDQDLLYI